MVVKFSERVAGIEISGIRKIFEAAGPGSINLGLGQPDFDTPQHIKDAAIKAIQEGKTGYTTNNGIPELRAAISRKFKRENGIKYHPDQLIITAGASEALHIVMQALLNPGDRVLCPDPGFVSYASLATLAGGKPVSVPLTKTLHLEVEKVKGLMDKATMVVLNSPGNPTGAVESKESIRAIVEYAADKGVTVVSDEVYEHFIYGKNHYSAAQFGDNVITINATSKTYAMTGWRLGYAVGPLEIIREMSKVQQHTISQATTFAMWGGVAALRGDQSCVEDMRKEFDQRRKYVISELKQMGYETAPADGAFYAFVKVQGDDMEVASRWLEKGHVAATPGSAFYAPGWIRLSYATSMEKLKEAMGRIKRVG